MWQIFFHLAKTETSWFLMENYKILALFTFLFVKDTLHLSEWFTYWLVLAMSSVFLLLRKSSAFRYLLSGGMLGICSKHFPWLPVVLTHTSGGRWIYTHFTDTEERQKRSSDKNSAFQEMYKIWRNIFKEKEQSLNDVLHLCS